MDEPASSISRESQCSRARRLRERIRARRLRTRTVAMSSRASDVNTAPVGALGVQNLEKELGGTGQIPMSIFSSNILSMDSDRGRGCCSKKNKKGSEGESRAFKAAAIVVGILCLLFMAATIGLSITLGLRSHEMPELDGFGHDGFFPDPLGMEAAAAHPKSSVTSLSRLNWPPPSGSLHATYRRAAVASDHGLCSEIGRNILLKGGNAIDSTIATLLCVGVVNPQSSGLGGGFLMTLYDAASKKCIAVDARETAPKAASRTMFVNSSEDAVTGWRSVATPGELHGFWTVFKNYGSHKISWKELVTPSIRLARNGFPVSNHLAMVLKQKEDLIRQDGPMKTTFVNGTTDKLFEEGEIVRRESLARTLEAIANSDDPVQLFYHGDMAKTIEREFREKGGHLTAEDLASFETLIYDAPLETNLLPEGLTMCGPPPPSSFAVTQAIVAVITQLYQNAPRPLDIDDTRFYHNLVEAEKFAYAYRTNLGDPRFVKSAQQLAQNMTDPKFLEWIVRQIPNEAQPLQYYSAGVPTVAPEDHGTSHSVVLDSDGNAVSTTTTVNQYLGSRRISPDLGILWNDEMDDFSTPGQANGFGFAPSEANFIEPGKRPLSSMSPTIVYNKETGKVKMVVGASGGSRIISAVAQVILRSLLLDQTIKEAVDAPRIHNQFLPAATEVETRMPKSIVYSLNRLFNQTLAPVAQQASVVQALLVDSDGFIHGNSDFRRRTLTYPTGF